MNGKNTIQKLRKRGDSAVLFGVNLLLLAVDVADGETVTIGSKVYEFDTDANSTEGNIPVDVSGGVTPAEAVDALVAVVNANQGDEVQAVDGGTTMVLALRVGGQLDCSETLAGAGNEWSEGSSFGQQDPADDVNLAAIATREVTADEVTAGQIAFAFGADVVSVVPYVTRAGAGVVWDGAVTITGTVVTLDNAGAVDWQAGDRITLGVAF